MRVCLFLNDVFYLPDHGSLQASHALSEHCFSQEHILLILKMFINQIQIPQSRVGETILEESVSCSFFPGKRKQYYR